MHACVLSVRFPQDWGLGGRGRRSSDAYGRKSTGYGRLPIDTTSRRLIPLSVRKVNSAAASYTRSVLYRPSHQEDSKMKTLSAIAIALAALAMIPGTVNATTPKKKTAAHAKVAAATKY